jgi:tRNA dimethylallyltransferase
MQQLIVIEGPTASGKTALAVSLARRLNTVVISADSRQFYKELAIGTAKPTKEEMDGIPHYFIDSHSICTPVTAAQFEMEAMELIKKKLQDFQKIIVAGGSGMFIDALCIGLDPIPKDELIQLSLRSELTNKGIDPLLIELKQNDPVFYQEVDRSNPARILRAIEVIRITGRPYSELRKQEPPTRPFEVIRFVIDHPREQLYDRINHRVDKMIDQGLIEEVRSVEAFKKSTTLQTVGYKEVFDYFDGIYSLDDCIEKIKQHTRNYAKRQLTWFRKHPDSIWIPFSSTEKMTQEILQVLD